MKRVCVVALLLSICLLLPVCAVPAVELQQGWYVKFGYVEMEGQRWTGDHIESWLSDWSASSATGQNGAVSIEQGDVNYKRGRIISVTQNASVAQGVLFEDYGPGFCSSVYPYYDTVSVGWRTNYDSSAIRLQLLRRRSGQPDELVWEQMQSGMAYADQNVWNSSPLLPGDAVVFRIVAVPEPSVFSGLACTMMCAFAFGRRRAKR